MRPAGAHWLSHVSSLEDNYGETEKGNKARCSKSLEWILKMMGTYGRRNDEKWSERGRNGCRVRILTIGIMKKCSA